jgi:hypothetical protein
VIARSAIVALAVAGSAIVLSAAPLQNRKTDTAINGTVAIGVACGDGTFVPVAARIKNRWKPLIEEEGSLGNVYGVFTSDARRLPRQGWTLYPPRAGAPQPLSLKSPLKKDESSGCLGVAGFKSDAPRLPPRHVRPYRGSDWAPQFGGIGLLGPARFEHGEDVTAQPDEDSRRVAANIVRHVQAVERRILRDSRQPTLERFAGRTEVRSVVRLMSMTRYRTDDGEWYFFQARKQYGEWYVFEGKRMYKDWARLLVHGWIRSSSGGLCVHGLDGRFVDDDWKIASVYRMTGVLVLDDRTVWIAEGSGYESQWYELFEIGPGNSPPHSVLSVPNGGF